MKQRYLVIGLADIGMGIALPPQRRDVLIKLKLPEELIDFARGLGWMAALSPAEARELSEALARKADEAEST